MDFMINWNTFSLIMGIVCGLFIKWLAFAIYEFITKRKLGNKKK